MRSTAIHEAELPASVGRRQASQLEAWLHGAGTSGTNMQGLIEVRWLQRACPDTNDAVRNKGCICAQQLEGTGFSSFSVNISKQPRAARPRVWLLSRHVQTSPEPRYWPRRGLQVPQTNYLGRNGASGNVQLSKERVWSRSAGPRRHAEHLRDVQQSGRYLLSSS